MVKYYQESRGENSHPYEVNGYNKNQIERQITGTYVPKELILDIASWISIEFYDKCNKVIIDYFVNEFKKMNKITLQSKIEEIEQQMSQVILEKNEEIKIKDDKIDEIKKLMLKQDLEREKDRQYTRSLGISLEEVKDQNNGLHKEVKKVQRKLGIDDKLKVSEKTIIEGIFNMLVTCVAERHIRERHHRRHNQIIQNFPFPLLFFFLYFLFFRKNFIFVRKFLRT